MGHAVHPYLRLDDSARSARLARDSDDELLLLRADLDALEEDCPLLAAALRERGLPARCPDHLLPPHFFARDARGRRLPNRTEHAWKRGLFLGARYGPPACGISAGILSNVDAHWGKVVGITLSLGLWGPLLFGWWNPFYRPLRYALVRPFNQRKFAKPLKRFVLRNIGLRCHGLTLSARHFQPNRAMGWLHSGFVRAASALAGVVQLPATIAALSAPWLRQSVRLAVLLIPSDFRHLDRILRQWRRQSVRHLMCGGQCFNIATTDAAWKFAMQALVNESDFVIVDLSFVKDGSRWELELLELRNRIPSCIAICQTGHEEALER